jgi:hypothetical protein
MRVSTVNSFPCSQLSLLSLLATPRRCCATTSSIGSRSGGGASASNVDHPHHTHHTNLSYAEWLGHATHALSQRVKAVPHRDVSRIPYAELLQLYTACRRHLAVNVPDMKQPPQQHREGRDGPHSHASASEDVDSVFNEWCLRSVFSTHWNEVDLDVSRMLLLRDHHQQRSSGSNVNDAHAASSSMSQVCCWPSVIKSLAAMPPDQSLDQPLCSEAATVLTTSLFVGSVPAYHNLSVAATGIGRGKSAGSPAPPLVRADGTKLLEATIARIRNRGAGFVTENVVPPLPADGPATSAEHPSAKHNHHHQRRWRDVVWIPFSTLLDIRCCAFGHHSSMTREGGNIPRPSPQDTLMLTGALQLVRQVLTLQQHVQATDESAVLVRVVPPSVELRSVLDVLAACRLRQTDSPQPKQHSGTLPGRRMHTAEELCESSLARWCAISKLLAPFVPPSSSEEGGERTTTCSLAVEGSLERRLVHAYGGTLRHQLASPAHKTPSPSRTTSPSSSGTHRSVVTQCGDLSRKLAQREQHAKGMPRY